MRRSQKWIPAPWFAPNVFSWQRRTEEDIQTYRQSQPLNVLRIVANPTHISIMLLREISRAMCPSGKEYIYVLWLNLYPNIYVQGQLTIIRFPRESGCSESGSTPSGGGITPETCWASVGDNCLPYANPNMKNIYFCSGRWAELLH
jgi:hypothetical protein